MSFSPLPTGFPNDLKTAASAAVEIGCGDGRFTRLLRDANRLVLTLDRDPLSAADIVGDARNLPLRNASLQMLVAANLLRHVWAGRGFDGIIATWQAVLRPGGRLWILEDEPSSRTAAEQNYEALQVFLARLYPRSRGLPMSLQTFRDLLAHGAGPAGGDWSFGTRENTYALDAPGELVRLLRETTQNRQSEARRLASAIETDGMSYGRYWWARFQRSDGRGGASC